MRQATLPLKILEGNEKRSYRIYFSLDAYLFPGRIVSGWIEKKINCLQDPVYRCKGLKEKESTHAGYKLIRIPLMREACRLLASSDR